MLIMSVQTINFHLHLQINTSIIAILLIDDFKMSIIKFVLALNKPNRSCIKDSCVKLEVLNIWGVMTNCCVESATELPC